MSLVHVCIACVASVPFPIQAERNIGLQEGRVENGVTTKSAENGARAKFLAPFSVRPECENSFSRSIFHSAGMGTLAT